MQSIQQAFNKCWWDNIQGQEVVEWVLVFQFARGVFILLGVGQRASRARGRFCFRRVSLRRFTFFGVARFSSEGSRESVVRFFRSKMLEASLFRGVLFGDFEQCRGLFCQRGCVSIERQLDVFLFFLGEIVFRFILQMGI